jgi:hypothetical protein
VFAKEIAVVFVAIAILVDLFRRDKLRFAWYGLYALIAVAFTALWFFLVAGGDPGEMGQTSAWWGGSPIMNAATMTKGFLYYGRLLILPINLAIGYHLPARAALDFGTTVSIVLVLLLVGGALLASPKSRFALIWFFLTLFPVSNLLIHMNLPTAERFLLLPSIGLCFAAGALLARTRLSVVVFACFIALTFTRTFDWRSDEALWESSLAVTESPTGLSYRTWIEIERAERSGDPADAEQVVKTAEAFFRYYRENIQMAPEEVPGAMLLSREDGGPVLLNQAKALLMLGRYREAYDSAMLAAQFGDLEEGYRIAEIARERGH